MAKEQMSPSGWLTIDQTAADLGVEPLAVKRLIARGRLRAVQVGAEGPWRVAASELARYIGAGAVDLKAPLLSLGWFDHRETTYPAQTFAERMIQAAAESLPQFAPDSDDGQVVLPLTPAMRAIMAAPVPRGVATPRGAPDFLDLAHVYFVDQARGLVKRGRGLRDLTIKRGLPPLAALYADPDAYALLTSDAMQRLAAGEIGFSHLLPVRNPRVNGSATRVVRFAIRHAAMLNPAREQAVLEAAF